MVRNHYEACRILNVNVSSSSDEWKSAYRNICKYYHPDSGNQTGGNAEMIMLAKEAYDFLCSENVAVIDNNKKPVDNVPVNTSRTIYKPATDSGYSYNHKEYVNRQKKLNAKAESLKRQRYEELKLKSQELKVKERQAKEKELIDKIRWLRVAQIIQDTIANDKKATNAGIVSSSRKIKE